MKDKIFKAIPKEIKDSEDLNLTMDKEWVVDRSAIKTYHKNSSSKGYKNYNQVLWVYLCKESSKKTIYDITCTGHVIKRKYTPKLSKPIKPTPETILASQ